MEKGLFTEKEKKIIINFAYEREWDKKIAKKIDNRIETLLIHHLKTLNILEKIFDLTKDDLNLAKDDLKIVLLAAFVHDTGKETEEWQEKITKGLPKYVPHVDEDLSKKIINELNKRLKWDLKAEKLIEIENIIMQHMEGSRKNPEETLKSILKSAEGKEEKKWVTLTHLLVFADRLASITEPSQSKLLFEGRGLKRLNDLIEIEYHQLNQIRGITTSLLHQSIEETMKKNNWNPILFFSNGTIYFRKKKEKNEKNFQWEELEKRIEEKLDSFFDSFKENESETIVGNPTASMITLARLFNWKHLDEYFEVAKNRTGLKSQSDISDKHVIKYLTMTKILKEKGYDAALTFVTSPKRYEKDFGEINEYSITDNDKIVEKVKSEMAEINPEATLFKFFKAIFDDETIATQEMVELARNKYDTIFGKDQFSKLQSMSTLQSVRDRITAIDNYWSLSVNELTEKSSDKKKIKDLPAKLREDILMNNLCEIAKEVYNESSTSKENEYYSILKEVAQLDFVHPNYLQPKDLSQLCKNYLNYWQESKHAQKSKAIKSYICPRCNQQYKEENLVAAEISGFKKKFSNRVIGGARIGSGLSICTQCELELLLRYIASKSQVQNLVVLYPEISIHRELGENIQKKMNEFEKGLEAKSLFKGENKFEVFSFWNIISAANKITQNPEFLDELERSQEVKEFLDLFSYQKSEESVQKSLQRAFERLLDEIGQSSKMKVISIEEAVEKIRKIDKTIEEEIIIDRLKEKLPSESKNVQFFYHTPNIFIWSTNQTLGSFEDESEVNLALKQFYIGTLISLFMNYSVAILNPDEILPNKAEGKVFIPSNVHIRGLFGNKEWISDFEIKEVCKKLSAAIILAKRAEYPSRSDIYSLLSEKIKGRILRRIEMKQKNLIASDIENLELL